MPLAIATLTTYATKSSSPTSFSPNCAETPAPQTITYNAKNQLSSITDTQQNVIPMTYTGLGQSERVSAGWVSANPDTPWGSNSYTYGSGLLSQTNSAISRSRRMPSGTETPFSQ